MFQNILGKLATYSANESPEKTYIKTDKDFYINGETIWYKVFLLDGATLTDSQKSNVIYVELLNSQDSVITQQKLFFKDSGGDGTIEIPETVKGGDYRLHAFTKYMLNEKTPIFHTKQISIKTARSASMVPERSENEVVPIATNSVIGERPLISFFPEGGDLVSGLISVLGIKATTAKGNGIALKGGHTG